MHYTIIATVGPEKPERRWHQENALYSWSLIEDIPKCIIGADDTTAKTLTQKYKFETVSTVLRAYDIGYYSQAPIIPDMLKQALSATEAQWLILVNADIVLMPEFSEQLGSVIGKLPSQGDPFITVRRRDYPCREPITNIEKLRSLPAIGARLHKMTGSDIFITTRKLWARIAEEMPAFIYGRFSWDVYFHNAALEMATAAVDASQTVESYHPYHGSVVDRNNPEMVYNLQMYEALFGEGVFALNDPRWLRL